MAGNSDKINKKDGINPNPEICLIAGARPNFMKIAALIPHLDSSGVAYHLLHTGQHYDYEMSEIFFNELGLPEPDVHLNVGSGTHAKQTAEVMVAFEEYCLQYQPKQIVVVGDVNSTLACSVVASKLGIFITHVEAGLRSFDWEMPEEINRVVTDRLTNLYLIHSPEAKINLLKEGAPESAIVDTGNVMIDTQKQLLPKAEESGIVEELGLKGKRFALCTLHRPSNVDEEGVLRKICEMLVHISSDCQMVLPLHPRTKKNLERFSLISLLEEAPGITLSKPLGYIDCLALVKESTFVITDSGGLQEETTALGVPCITMRENTERPVTITEGTNQLLGRDDKKIIAAVNQILAGDIAEKRCPVLWDGNAGKRCVDAILDRLRAIQAKAA